MKTAITVLSFVSLVVTVQGRRCPFSIFQDDSYYGRYGMPSWLRVQEPPRQRQMTKYPIPIPLHFEEIKHTSAEPTSTKPTPTKQCPPQVGCRIECTEGFLKDEQGCEICRCKSASFKRRSCPRMKLICKNECAFGSALNRRGCPTCTCNPGPGSSANGDEGTGSGNIDSSANENEDSASEKEDSTNENDSADKNKDYANGDEGSGSVSKDPANENKDSADENKDQEHGLLSHVLGLHSPTDFLGG